MKNDLVDYLTQLGLSEVESHLYLTLLESGSIGVRELARSVGVKRTTAYLYIEKLVEMGLVTKIVNGARKQVSATQPEDSLKVLIDQKVAEARRVKERLPMMLIMIQKTLLPFSSVDEAEIRYYKGKIGVKKVYDEALASGELRLYVNLAELARLLVPNSLGLDLHLFDNALAKNKQLAIFEIIADEPHSVNQFELDRTAQNGKYAYKFMPSEVGLTSPAILLYDNKVAIITGNDTLTTIVLSNAAYYLNSKKLFDYNWNTLPRVSL